MPETFIIEPVDTLIISIGVLALGGFITRRVSFLQRYAIPTAVTGGLIVSLAVLLVFRLAGLHNAAEIGIAFATFGLVAGGLLGGPMGEWLIKRHHLGPDHQAAPDAMMDEGESRPHRCSP